MSQERTLYEAALNQGHTFSWDQQWREAIKAFQTAISHVDNEPAAFAGLGMAHYELQNLEQALENYKQAARFSGGDIMYLRQIARVQEELTQEADAGQTYMAIGEAHLRRRRLDEAVENWHRAVRLNPALLGGHQRLAAVYQRQGLNQAAIREYVAVARILQAQGDGPRALKACQAALLLDPRNREVLTAVELIEQGQAIPGEAFTEEVPPELTAVYDELSTVDGDGLGEGAWPDARGESGSPVQEARRMALEQLAEEIFDADADSSSDIALSKLQRDALISQALDFQTRGMANEAIGCYEQAVNMGVDSTAVHFNLGLMYQERMRFDEAVREFEVAVNDAEYRLGAHFALGECHRARGRIDRAVEHFITVLKIVDLQTVRHEQADRLIHLYENLTDSLVTRGEPDRATAFATTLVEFLSHKGWEDKVKDARSRLDALSGGGTMILGDILTSGSEYVLESLYLSQEYAKRGLYNAAMEEAYRIIQLTPDYLPAHMQLGTLLARQKRTEAAVQKYVTVGDAFRSRGDISNAINAYERVVDISPLDVSIRSRIIDLSRSHGQIDRALTHFLALGEAYYQLAQLERARDAYQDGLKLTPRGSEQEEWRDRFLRQIGDIDMQRLDWPRALVAFRELWDADPTDERTTITLIDLYYKVGQAINARRTLDKYLIALIKSGRGAKVVGILEDMVRQHPQDQGLLERLARLYTQQQRKLEAIAILDRLGEEQINQGQNDKAIATIERILALKPAEADSYRQLLTQLRSGAA